MTERDELFQKITAAVKAANAAEQSVTTAQAELVSRSKAVGLLLLEAKKLHPAVTNFEAFLKKVQGLKLSRAYDYMRIAGGRTTDEEIRKATRDRVKKHRDKKKLPPTHARRSRHSRRRAAANQRGKGYAARRPAGPE
jgi:hypothetical protein